MHRSVAHSKFNLILSRKRSVSSTYRYTFMITTSHRILWCIVLLSMKWGEEKAKGDSSVAPKECFDVATAASSAPYHVAQGKFSIELDSFDLQQGASFSTHVCPRPPHLEHMMFPVPPQPTVVWDISRYMSCIICIAGSNCCTKCACQAYYLGIWLSQWFLGSLVLSRHTSLNHRMLHTVQHL